MDDTNLPPMPPPRSPSPTLPSSNPAPNSTPSPQTQQSEPGIGPSTYSENSEEVEPVSSSHDPTTAVPLKEEVADHEGKFEGGKQKRKRTSPEDQAFLEAQYKENPKPNKAARAEIVKSVRLNEKEVQIWFQNRRQINRRKSRPLLPHEIAAFGLGLSPLSSDPASVVCYSSSQETDEQNESFPPHEALEILDNEEEPKLSQDVQQLPAPEETPIVKPTETIAEGIQNSPLKIEPNPLVSEMAAKETRSHSVSEALSQSFSATPGYLANRWNTVNPFSTPVAAQSVMFTTPAISRPIFPSSCPERITTDTTPSSKCRVRLSTGLDGRAELVEGELTPPRPHAERPTSYLSSVIPLKRMRSLQRSHSALPLGSSSFNGPFTPRLPSGRSRDARTWEFCAEGEPRDELTTQAENESNGSAIAAISLIRSISGSALKSNPSKRNAPSRPLQVKRPKMGRASSSVARMQSGVKKQKQPVNDKDPLRRSPSGDSDKENWVPHSNGVNPRRRPAHVRTQSEKEPKGILQDNLNIPTHADFGVNGNKRRKSAHAEPQVYEDTETSSKTTKTPDDDVRRFMRGPVSPSKKDDVDCIQGLLSLSQGNWR